MINKLLIFRVIIGFEISVYYNGYFQLIKYLINILFMSVDLIDFIYLMKINRFINNVFFFKSRLYVKFLMMK